ncbi:MAG TPA: gamma-glutamyl-gamma-aminobutyrate hydrolase family protein [Actinomycetota bacterium]|nr:gamma-glutamyl-gamma-aminobutyrate hydrolase family protein [Actinomycetota bacterium]
MTAPLIAVAGKPLRAGAVRGWREPGVGVPSAYVEALHRAGGQEAVLLPVELAPEDAARRLARFDALLLIGGGDVDPARYGEERHPSVYGVEPERDAFEIALVRAALERRIPTLAVCRGSQVLNVALGGTLTQHLEDESLPGHGDPRTEGPFTHAVRLEPGSRVARAMGVERADCASHHHQGMAKLGPGLVATGWADDGVVEAVEHEDGWMLGVQWHPEETSRDDPVHQALFDALVRAASG